MLFAANRPMDPTDRYLEVDIASNSIPLFNEGEEARAESEPIRSGLLLHAALNQVLHDAETAMRPPKPPAIVSGFTRRVTCGAQKSS